MLVWNGFVHDARVTKEAETLIANGYDVSVIAVSTPERPVTAETTDSGINVQRVQRECKVAYRIIFGPRLAWRCFNRIIRKKKGKRIKEVRAISVSSEGLLWEQWLIFRIEEVLINWKFFRSALRIRPTIIHAHDVNVLVPAWMAGIFARSKLVYDAHEISIDREGYRKVTWLIWFIESYIGKRADAFITTTDERANFFVHNYGYREALVLQNRPRFSCRPKSEILRASCGIQNNYPIILYQGGLQWGRGLRNLVLAVRELHNVNLVFLGSGVEEPSLRALVNSEGMEQRIYFHQMVDLQELPLFTASADIGVQTIRNTCLNHYTTDSNKLFEYLMAALPVVASDFPEIRKIVAGYSVGLTVDPESVDGIRDALRILLQDRALYKQYQENARMASRELCWEGQEAELVQLYGALAS